jgi:hypothetical protein
MEIAQEPYLQDAEYLSMGSDMGQYTLARKYRCAYIKGDSL